MMEKICVLMAAYNGVNYIEEQIITILSQNDVEVDLFIRLDPSIDKTEYIIRGFLESYNNIFLISPEKPSGSAGQNFFRLLLEVDFSDYDYIAFCDQDDIWMEDKLSRALYCLKNSNADAYSSNVLAFWNDGKEKIINKAFSQKKYDYLFESSGPGCTFLLNRHLALEIKYFLISLGSNITKLWLHDWFCYAFARSRGFSWYIDKKAMMKYRQHDCNSVGANTGFSAFMNRVKDVVSGKAIDKSLQQAELLNLTREKPIELLASGKALDLIKLSFYAPLCRRKISDRFIFMIAMIICALWKL